MKAAKANPRRDWLKADAIVAGTEDAVLRAQDVLSGKYAIAQVRDGAKEFVDYLRTQPPTEKQGFEDEHGNEYFVDPTEVVIEDPKTSIDFLMNWLPSFTLMGPLGNLDRPLGRMTLSELTACLTLMEAFDGDPIAAQRGGVLLEMLENLNSPESFEDRGQDVRSKAEQMLQAHLKTLMPGFGSHDLIDKTLHGRRQGSIARKRSGTRGPLKRAIRILNVDNLNDLLDTLEDSDRIEDLYANTAGHQIDIHEIEVHREKEQISYRVRNRPLKDSPKTAAFKTLENLLSKVFPKQ